MITFDKIDYSNEAINSYWFGKLRIKHLETMVWMGKCEYEFKTLLVKLLFHEIFIWYNLQLKIFSLECLEKILQMNLYQITNIDKLTFELKCILKYILRRILPCENDKKK